MFSYLEVLLSMVSSYYYVIMAAYVNLIPMTNGHVIIIVLTELFFAVAMGLKFLLAFTKDGETIPTTDLG